MRHLHHWLIAQAAEDQGAEKLVGEKIPESGSEGPCAGGVVRHVEDEFRCGVILGVLDPYAFEASRPPGIADSLDDRLWSDTKPVADGEFERCGDGESDVAMLMYTTQWGIHLDDLAENFNLIGVLLISVARSWVAGRLAVRSPAW